MAGDRLYLTMGVSPNHPGKILAIISRGSPQMGDEHVVVLTLQTFDTDTEAQEWGLRMMDEQPWETRN